MKIAIYDGILETHVASSLERALCRRGHEVLNTGKIGHGFNFPSQGDDIGHLEVAVSRVLSFRPDLVFVMRPASLPFGLIEKLKGKGMTLIAWFSDDPVLFDLSYGPILNEYDYVLHCGNAKVLEFYESRFNRPTGVNFPFWTDHESFPVVWGTQPSTTDALFIGNMNDEVRRARYFALADLELDIRVHGNIGADYFGLSGGYLLTDAEVADSGATTKLALNIPQFFKDHRGLPTWFEGLDELGFFEYPSRVIQYMAMGIPTISVIPGAPVFKSYPEMIVVDSIGDAGVAARNLLDDGKLAELSESVVERFDRFFCADSRVLALEALLENDDWRNLDPHDREIWFTQFDAKRSSTSEGKEKQSIHSPSAQHPIPEIQSELGVRAIIYGNGADRSYSRLNSVMESMRKLNYETIQVRAGSYPTALSRDPKGNFAKVLDAETLARNIDLTSADYFIICSFDVILSEDSKTFLANHNVKTIFIDDSQKLSIERVGIAASSYDFVCVSSEFVAQKACAAGFDNISVLPHFVNPKFMNIIRGLDNNPEAVLRIRDSEATEKATCPAFVVDVSGIPETIVINFEDLASSTLEELALSLHSRIAMLSFGGTKSQPLIGELAPYVAMATENLFVARNPVQEHIFPYQHLGVNVAQVGELARKAREISTSTGTWSQHSAARLEHLPLVADGPRQVAKVITKLEKGRRFESQATLQEGLVKSFSITPNLRRLPYNAIRIELSIENCAGDLDDWWYKVRKRGAVQGGGVLQKRLVLLLSNCTKEDYVEIEIHYLKGGLKMNSSHALNAELTVNFLIEKISGRAESLSRIYSVV